MLVFNYKLDKAKIYLIDFVSFSKWILNKGCTMKLFIERANQDKERRQEFVSVEEPL
jgi:hypothetical protein